MENSGTDRNAPVWLNWPRKMFIEIRYMSFVLKSYGWIQHFGSHKVKCKFLILPLVKINLEVLYSGKWVSQRLNSWLATLVFFYTLPWMRSETKGFVTWEEIGGQILLKTNLCVSVEMSWWIQGLIIRFALPPKKLFLLIFQRF